MQTDLLILLIWVNSTFCNSLPPLISAFPPLTVHKEVHDLSITLCVRARVCDSDLIDAWLCVFVSQPPVEGRPPLQIKLYHRDWQFRWHDLRSQHQRLKFFWGGEPVLRWRFWRLELRRCRRTEVVVAANGLSQNQHVAQQSDQKWKFDRFSSGSTTL